MREMLVLVGLVLAVLAGIGRGEEWPKWMGPNGDGISHEPIADKWPGNGPKKLWEQKVGVGYASPIALDGKVYLFYQAGNQDTLGAFDAESGKVLWTQGYQATMKADPSGPQDTNREFGVPVVLATPTIDNGKIYSYGAGGDLVCRKLADGSEIWHISTLKELNESILQWAEASAPLVTDKFVYVQCGSGGPTAIAVDKETGKIAWKSQAQTVASYAAATIIDVQGTKQLIIDAGEQLYGMNLQTGATIWSLPWTNRPKINAATPVYKDGHLFVSADYQIGCMMVAVSPGSAKVEWKNTSIQQKFQPAILDNGYLYTNSEGTLKCMRWPDGKIMWENNMRLGSGGSVVRDGDKLIVMSERGKLNLVQATPESSKVISSVQMFDFSQTWSTPLIYRGKLYTMGKDTLVCLDIGPHAVAEAR